MNGPCPDSQPPSRRTQAERRAQTERRVLDAALRLIARSGSRTMSLAQVGEEAGYSRGIVTHQFGSRDELLRRAAVHAQRAVAPPRADLAGLATLLAFVDSYLDALVEDSPASRAFLLMWVEAVAADPSLHPVYTDRDTQFRASIADIVAQGVGDGSIRAGVDPAAVAVVVLGQLRGIGLQLILTPAPASPDAIRRETLAMVRRNLRPTDG